MLTGPEPEPVDTARRFGGVQRLFGQRGLDSLQASHVLVAGIGGVGSWAAEALARSGVGGLTLVDLDHIAESNINRQIHALESTLGASKVEVMADRIRQISPDCKLVLVDDFLTLENLAQYVPAEVDVVIDAIDQARVKAALIAHCRARKQPLVVCGAAGGRTDPLSLRRDDLALTRGDALLAGVRARIRREYGFSRKAGAKFGVTAIYSEQAFRGVRGSAEAAAVAATLLVGDSAAAPDALSQSRGDQDAVNQGGAALACSGFGSLVSVTATMGFAAAQWAIDTIVLRRTA